MRSKQKTHARLVQSAQKYHWLTLLALVLKRCVK